MCSNAGVLSLVRHGRTEANANGLLLGRLDPGLDRVGEWQVSLLADALGPVDRVVTSPLLRARQTAAALGAPVEVDERVVELDYGELDGLPLAEVPASLWARWREDPTFAPPGGESLAELGRRVAEAMADLAEEARERNIVVVSHVLRNAMIPFVTVAAIDIPLYLTGAVLTETVFSWPGMGRLFYDSLTVRDYPVLMGIVILGAVLIVIGNLIADLLYGLLDPRIKYD